LGRWAWAGRRRADECADLLQMRYAVRPIPVAVVGSRGVRSGPAGRDRRTSVAGGRSADLRIARRHGARTSGHGMVVEKISASGRFSGPRLILSGISGRRPAADRRRGGAPISAGKRPSTLSSSERARCSTVTTSRLRVTGPTDPFERGGE
jgi:hypothetical protein